MVHPLSVTHAELVQELKAASQQAVLIVLCKHVNTLCYGQSSSEQKGRQQCYKGLVVWGWNIESSCQ